MVTDKEEFNCVDCGAHLSVPVAGTEDTLCTHETCRRRYRVFGKKRSGREAALSFYEQQPSTQRKRFERLDSGRYMVAFAYDEEQRFDLYGLLDIIEDYETLRLLLAGISHKYETPVVLVFPVKPEQEQRLGKELVVHIDGVPMGRLDSANWLDFISPGCRLIRAVLPNACLECDAKSGLDILRESAGNESAPRAYLCWLGRLELACSVAVNHVSVATLITGQFADHGNVTAHALPSIEELEKRFPELVDGIEITQEIVREARLSEADVSAMHQHLECRAGTSVLKLSGLMAWLEKDAESRQRVIRNAKDMKTWNLILDMVRNTLQDHIAREYRRHRDITQERFLEEVYALLDCLQDAQETKDV